MVQSPSFRTIKPCALRFSPGARVFEHLHKIILILDALSISLDVLTRRQLRPSPAKAFFSLIASAFDFEVRIPCYRTIELLSQNKEPEFLEIEIHEIPDREFYKLNAISVGLANMLVGLTAPIFCDFFELYRPWIRANLGGNPYSWPPILNFSRVVRNFISHHHGRVHFDNKNAPTIQWRHLSYSPSDEGRVAVGPPGGMANADLIFLLFDLVDELDVLGCPVL